MEPTLTFSIKENSHHLNMEKKITNNLRGRNRKKAWKNVNMGKKINLEVYSLQAAFHLILSYPLPQ